MKPIKFVLSALATVALLTPAVGSAAVSTNLISNGSFEATVVSAYSTLGTSSGALTGWTINSGSIDLIGSYWKAQEGKQSLDLNGLAANGVISQAFNTMDGQSYNVSFWIAGNPDDAVKLKSGTVSAAGQSQSFTFNTTGKTRSSMGWVEQSFSFVASGKSSTLTFASTQATKAGSFSSWGPALDNVSVTAVPEPETYALLLAGLGLIGAVARRRKGQQT